MSDTPTTAQQAPDASKPAAQPSAPPEATATPVTDPKPGDPATGFKSEESKAAVLADLAKERDARQALEAKIDAQNKAMAAAFGLAEPPKTEDLAATVKNLQQQFEASQLEATRLRIAAEKNIPAEYHDLLTETDPEKLKAQAEKVGALVAAHTAAAAPPAFQANPGQGQGGQPLSDEAKAEAEYELFYPTSNRK